MEQYHREMNSRHRRTLERIFSRPTPAGIRWTEIEAMSRALNIDVVERSGSRVLLRRGSERIVVHRPHPGSEVGRSSIRDIARFLEQIGEKPC